MEETNKSLEQAGGEAAIPDTKGEEPQKENEPGLTIKYNKEIKELTNEQAKNLAQKGLKYEQIESEYLRLKNIAKNQGLDVDELLCSIEKEKANTRREELIKASGGNQELADYIIKLENSKENNSDFEELNKMFPEIKEIGELPQEVIDTSNTKGKNLLDCYLRYLFSKASFEKATTENNKISEKAGIGSLKSGGGSDASELNREFIKGLWNK